MILTGRYIIIIGTKAVTIEFDTFTFPTLHRGKGPIERWAFFLFFGKQNLNPNNQTYLNSLDFVMFIVIEFHEFKVGPLITNSNK